MQNLPVYVSILFAITTLLTVILFFKATQSSKTTLIILLVWLALQSMLGLSGFYSVTDTVPPRFLLLLAPPIILIFSLFISPKGRRFMDGLDIKTLTLLHIVRIPVEIVLFWLFVHNTVPELMTFEGRNFDIFSGITAPIVFYFGFVKKRLNKKVLLAWNVICLGLLINIVTNAILSAPFPFQQFAFDQPNTAVLYFPFNWLPACVVPLVLFSHLVAIRWTLKR